MLPDTVSPSVPTPAPAHPLAPHLARERAAPDPDVLQRLVAARGLDAAEDMICRALAELACRQDEIEAAHRACRFDRIGTQARCMAALCDKIGLPGLARISRDTETCAQAMDPVALGAVLARLGRLCARTLADAWDIVETGGG